MKKLLLLFLFSFIVIFSFAQFPTYQPVGSPTTLWDQKGAVRGVKGLINGSYTDTTQANAGNIDFYLGAQIFTTSDDQIWVRDATATRWINVTTGFSPTPTCGLQSGTGIVHYDSLLIFSVTAANYSLCCDSVPRTSAADSILLPPADPSNPVYVAIILDANGVNYVRGIPAANPSIPQLTDCQILLTTVLINAGDIVPANVSVTTIYDENYTSEWDSVTTSTLVMDTANTTFPVHLLKDIDVTSYGTGGYMEFWTANTVDLNNYGILKFYVRLKGVATIRFSLTWYLDGVQQTFSAVPLVISGITGVYQVMAVPISAFRILNNSSVNKLRIQVFGTQGFYLDWIQLQAGIIPSSPIDNGFTTLNVGNLDSLFNSTVVFPIGQPVVIYTKQIVPSYTALVRPYNTNGPFEWNKINLATPITTGLLAESRIAPGNANDILTTIGGISTWVPSASGYDTTITFNWLRSYPGTVRDSIAFGSPYLDSALLTFDTYVGLDNKFLKIMQDDEILFLLDPAGFSAFLRAYDGASESVIGTEADLVNSSLFFTLKSKNGADSVWIVGNGQNKKITFIADSLLFTSTLAGATTGMVWKLKDVTTGSGYWGTGASSLFVDARNGLTDSLGYVLLGGSLYKATTVTAGVFAMNVNGSTGSFNSSFTSGGVTTSSNVSAGVGQFSTTQGSFSAIVSAVNGIVPITVTDGTKTSLLYTYPDSIINRSTDGIYKFYNMPSAVGTKAVRWDPTTKQFTIADTTVAGGGGGTALANFYLKDSTLSSNRAVDFGGFTLTFANAPQFVVNGGGQKLLNIDFSNNIYQIGDIDLFNNGTSISINDATNFITYRGGHTFTGGNVGIGVTPSADELFRVYDGSNNLIRIDKTNFETDIEAQDGTAETGLQMRANSGGGIDATLFSTDGTTAGSTILLDAIAQTITLTADTLLFNSTLSGAVTGYVWKLKDATTGSGYWGSTYVTAGNGLTDSSGRVILGGTLYKNTTVNTAGFTTTWTGLNDVAPSFTSINTGAGEGVRGQSTSGPGASGLSTSGYGLQANSTSGFGIYAQSSTNIAIEAFSNDTYAGYFITKPTSTNVVVPIFHVEAQSDGTAANGMGGSIEYYLEVSTNANNLSNELISKWTDATAATRTSQFIITGVNSAVTGDIISFEGNKRVLFLGRSEYAKGANVASGGDLTLGLDGNLFHITGTTTINAIIVANWQAGSIVRLIFDGNVTVKNNTAGGAGTAVMLLAGAADFSATANDVLALTYDGTSWFEVSRSVN